MDVLVDTSVWISFFRGRREDAKVCEALDYLLSGDEVVVNDVILSELLPPIVFRKERRVEECLKSVRKVELTTDWEDVRRMQVVCIATGINKVGIPDLMIAQQSVQKGLPVFSLDGHFRQMARKLPLKLWPAPRNSAFLRGGGVSPAQNEKGFAITSHNKTHLFA